MFSRKYGYKPEKILQVKSMSNGLRNRIWNLFYQEEVQARASDVLDIETIMGHQDTIAEKIADKLGFLKSSAQTSLEEFVLGRAEWCEVYDFIEVNISFLQGKEKRDRTRQYNKILEDENAGYRIVAGSVTPITNDSEIKTIEDASTSQFESVNQHIEKALLHYADLKNPDYANSIKESISAVEAMCCIITNKSGKQATLGVTIKELERHGVYIHSAMKKGFESLYGYASDEDGIRHGGKDLKNVPAEDAKYMLVTCSAFINYLVEKWSKIENE